MNEKPNGWEDGHEVMPAGPDLCEQCDQRPCVEDEVYCQECLDNQAEAAYERQQEGECFRGTEASAFEQEQMAEIQRKFK